MAEIAEIIANRWLSLPNETPHEMNVQWCRKAVRTAAILLRKATSKKERRNGYLYVVFNPLNYSFKIGQSIQDDPYRRLTTLYTQSGCPLQLAALFEGMADTEKHIHEALLSSRGIGEWFDFTADVMWAISHLVAAHGIAPTSFMRANMGYGHPMVSGLAMMFASGVYAGLFRDGNAP